MNWFQRVWRRLFRRSASVTVTSPRYGGTYWPEVAGGPAMSVATAYRCIRLLSESVASLPLQYMRQKDGIFAPAVNDRLYSLLTVQPNANQSAFDFWSQLVTDVLTQGNAYVVPVFVGYDIDSLILCTRNTVSYDETANTYTVNDTLNGLSGVYGEDEIIHVRNLTVNGKRGVSTLYYAKMCLDIASVGDAETLTRFSTGGAVRGLVANPSGSLGVGEYQDDQLSNVSSDLDSRFRSGERIVSVPGQVEFKQISLSSTDLQFLESRKFAVRDICRFFGVHPSFVFDDTSNNYKSAEMANVAFLCNTLNPLLRRIEGEFLRKLVAPSLWGKRRFEFDRRALYAGDLTSLIGYQTATIQAGLYTVNEWRAMMNRPAVEGGDKPLISANLRTIEELSEPAPEPAPALEPAPEPDNEQDDE